MVADVASEGAATHGYWTRRVHMYVCVVCDDRCNDMMGDEESVDTFETNTLTL